MLMMMAPSGKKSENARRGRPERKCYLSSATVGAAARIFKCALLMGP
jgi:hypothetical protein